jgi:hypothetical protein
MLSRNCSEGNKEREKDKEEVDANKGNKGGQQQNAAAANGWNKDVTAEELLDGSYYEDDTILEYDKE